MCGRYLQLASGEAMAAWFGFQGGPALSPRFNIAPSQNVPVVRRAESRGHSECVLMRWGLVPSWAKEGSFNFSTINARAETLVEKPTFCNSFKRRRCLVPADCFYEWKATGGKHKQPFVIRPVDGKLLGFAGLWDRWHSPAGETLESMTIVTTAANDVMRPLHERMPVILPPEHFALWLDPACQKTALLTSLLMPCPNELLFLTPVSVE